ncbi:MAG: chemotaxis protein CheA [Gammaproteobacteria bacterium]|nr:chemotaxis protein CheA [Gammaproteobacteria bacterium]
MSPDLDQFHGIFFEEAEELVETMERELLEMIFDSEDPEKINDVFRAAHSIKGGAATFGFSAIAEVTHVMETLLDGVRGGSEDVGRDLIDMLLRGVDCVSDMLKRSKKGQELDTARADEVKDALKEFLDASGLASKTAVEGSADSSTPESKPTEATESATTNTFYIMFKPDPTLFYTGNDPMHILRGLRLLGSLDVNVQTRALPPFEEFEADKIYLSWDLVLETQSVEDVVREEFAWVADVCDLEVKLLHPGEIPPHIEAQLAEKAETKAETKTAGSTADVPQAEMVEAGATRGRERKTTVETSSIRVGTEKIDELINLVGELVITQAMLSQMGKDVFSCDQEKLQEGFALLERNTRELQENVLQIRMVPVSQVFNRVPRMIHDLSSRLGKSIELQLTGEHTEIDKTVMEKVGDPLMHIVRNAIDHGIETPAARRAAGKPDTGVLKLNAYHSGGSIIIDVGDDGAGLNTDRILEKARENGLVGENEALSDANIHDLIFQPGFSTVTEVTDISGRGVGMDVVRRNIQAVDGTVELSSEPGKGSTVSIRLPLTLAIVDGQLVSIGSQIFVVPLISIIESIQMQPENLSSIAETDKLYRIRGEYVPIISLARLLNVQAENDASRERLIVFVDGRQGKIGLLVDELLDQQQVVIKSLESNYQRVEGVSGATILGDGTVALILDIGGLVSMSLRGNCGPLMVESDPAPTGVHAA